MSTASAAELRDADAELMARVRWTLSVDRAVQRAQALREGRISGPDWQALLPESVRRSVAA